MRSVYAEASAYILDNATDAATLTKTELPSADVKGVATQDNFQNTNIGTGTTADVNFPTSYNGKGSGKNEVKVTVSGGKITDVSFQ